MFVFFRCTNFKFVHVLICVRACGWCCVLFCASKNGKPTNLNPKKKIVQMGNIRIPTEKKYLDFRLRSNENSKHIQTHIHIDPQHSCTKVILFLHARMKNVHAKTVANQIPFKLSSHISTPVLSSSVCLFVNVCHWAYLLVSLFFLLFVFFYVKFCTLNNH